MMTLKTMPAAEQDDAQLVTASLDGSRVIRVERCGPRADPESLGMAVGEALLAQGAGPLLEMAQPTPPGSAG